MLHQNILKMLFLKASIQSARLNLLVRLSFTRNSFTHLVSRPYAMSSGDESTLSQLSQRSRASSGSKKDRHVSMGHVEMRILDVDSEEVIKVSDREALCKSRSQAIRVLSC